MIKLGSISEFASATVTELNRNDVNLLIIHQDEHFYLIENKCGHFGQPLLKGEIREKEIVCPGHGISFSLETGAVLNRPYENCAMICVYKIVQQDSDLYMDDDFS